MMYATDVDLYTAARNGASEQGDRHLAEGANVNWPSAEGNKEHKDKDRDKEPRAQQAPGA